MNRQLSVGVLGATSSVGMLLLPRLFELGYKVNAFSRREYEGTDIDVVWRRVGAGAKASQGTPNEVPGNIPFWICVAPIWVLAEYFSLMECCAARRIVVLSSTSRFTKHDSSDYGEQLIAHRLAEAEESVKFWAQSHDIEWIILRPTLIYGFGRDKNISEIAMFIRKFGFFPLFGKAQGLRQPVHVLDVACACLAVLDSRSPGNRAYNLSGGEILTYREMVIRVFAALGLRDRLFTVPRFVFQLSISVIRCFPRYRSWSTAMAERMNNDLVFDHSDATLDFGYNPRMFILKAEDLFIKGG